MRVPFLALALAVIALTAVVAAGCLFDGKCGQTDPSYVDGGVPDLLDYDTCNRLCKVGAPVRSCVKAGPPVDGGTYLLCTFLTTNCGE